MVICGDGVWDQLTDMVIIIISSEELANLGQIIDCIPEEQYESHSSSTVEKRMFTTRPTYNFTSDFMRFLDLY